MVPCDRLVAREPLYHLLVKAIWKGFLKLQTKLMSDLIISRFMYWLIFWSEEKEHSLRGLFLTAKASFFRQKCYLMLAMGTTCYSPNSIAITCKPQNLRAGPLNSRAARVSFGLWILKVKGPTLNLNILNAEVVLITVWGATFWNRWEYYGLL